MFCYICMVECCGMSRIRLQIFWLTVDGIVPLISNYFLLREELLGGWCVCVCVWASVLHPSLIVPNLRQCVPHPQSSVLAVLSTCQPLFSNEVWGNQVSRTTLQGTWLGKRRTFTIVSFPPEEPSEPAAVKFSDSSSKSLIWSFNQ